MGIGKSIKKATKSVKNAVTHPTSTIKNIVSNPTSPQSLGTIAGLLTGGLGGGLVGYGVGDAITSQPLTPVDTSPQDSLNAYNNYMNNAADYLKSRTDLGNDNQDLLQGYQNYLSDYYSKNPNSMHDITNEDLFKNYSDQLTNTNKNVLQNAFNSMYGGFGTTNSYLDNAWNMNADQSFLDDYLNNLQTDVQGRLDTAKARGLLNEAGYSNAVKDLGSQRTAANSAANTLTNSVLQNYRDDLANLAAGQQTAIDSYSLANRNNYNIGQFQDAYNDLLSQQQQSLQGDLTNAVQGYQPFDVSSILASARDKQGVIGGSNNSELLASMQQREKDQTNKIGLGNQGLF